MENFFFTKKNFFLILGEAVRCSTQFGGGGPMGRMRLVRRGRESRRGGFLGERVRGHPKRKGGCLPHSTL